MIPFRTDPLRPGQARFDAIVVDEAQDVLELR